MIRPNCSLKNLFIPLALGAACLFGSRAALAANPVQIPVVLPLTGGASFLGLGEKQALQIEANVVNQQGGVDGKRISFRFHDDQSNPQTAVQLTSQITAQHPNVMIGSAIVANCNAMAPLAADGPVMYCLSPAIYPKSGSFVFSSFISTHDLALALLTYFRERGLTRIAMITSTDATGQDGAKNFMAALRLPENKGLHMVAAVRFDPTDVSISAQIEKIQVAHPQALIVWSTGSPFGTVLKGIVQSGINIPVATTDANMTLAQMKQYAAFMPAEMLFMSSEWPPHTTDLKLPAAVEKARDSMFAAYKAAAVSPDVTTALAWDPGMLVIDTLRALGPQATPEQIRAHIASINKWAGINGIYNFKALPQRGLNMMDCVVTRWNAHQNSWVIVSKPGGAPL